MSIEPDIFPDVYTVIAIYGYDYLTAAKKTQELFGERGYELVMQNNIVVNIIFASSLACASVCGLIAYFVGEMFFDSEEVIWVGVIISVIVSLVIVESAFTVIDSTTCAILVCYFCHKEVLQQHSPILFSLLSQEDEEMNETNV